MRTHALPPSLLPSPLAHRAPAKSRDLVAPPPPPPGESTRRAAWGEFPPPPYCLARRPSPSPSSRLSLPSVLFVFHLFARRVVTLGELAGRPAGRSGTSEQRICAHAFLLFPQLAAFVASE